MNFQFKYIPALLLLLTVAACSKQKFSEMNTDPDAVLTIPPQYEFSAAVNSINSADFEYYYDYNRAINYWTQSFTRQDANANTVYDGSGNLNNRTNNFYGNVGNKLTDVRHLIDIMPEAEKAKFVYLRAIAGIPLAYYAWYVSDVQGSIAYSEAFQARYTVPSLLTPKYDLQEALYANLDAQLKEIVAILKTPQTVVQAPLGNNDQYYFGNIPNWIKAANSLRLKIAMKLMKRSPEKLKAIALEVLADNGGVINSAAEEWKFVGGPGYAGGGNYNPNSNSVVSGAKNMVDFMWKTKDPRTRIFYKTSVITKDIFDSAKFQNKIPASLVWDGQLYRGQFVDPDAVKVTANNYYFSAIVLSYKGVQTTVRFPSVIQIKLFSGSLDGGNGLVTFPVITYADMCLTRAELAVRGITTENAKEWYDKGIEASLYAYDAMGKAAVLPDYSALTPAEVAAFKTQAGIVYEPANGLEQILVQQFINYWKNQNEAWAVIKRTGFPSPAGNIMKSEIVKVEGIVQEMPRRFVVDFPSITDLNYANRISMIDEQKKDADFGTPDNIRGRVWWDKK